MNREEVNTIINENIATSSYTTALEVRESLAAILDYLDQRADENDEVISTINTNLEDNNLELEDHEDRIDALEQSTYLFQHFIENPITDDKNRLNFWYSFRGVKNGYVSYTFRMAASNEIRGKYGESFTFDLSSAPQLITALNSVLSNVNNKHLSFIVGFANFSKSPDYKRTAAITFYLNDNKLVHEIYPMDQVDTTDTIFLAGDEIFTSFELHYPLFKF